MRKSIWVAFLISLSLATFLFFMVPPIHASAESWGYNKNAKVIETEKNILGAYQHKTTSSIISQSGSILYVANTQEDCSNLFPCYINTGSAATGLQDAITAASPGDQIVILKDYPIRDNTILIDKNLTIRGHENAKITYDGNICNNPMLLFTAGGTLEDLTVNGGECNGASRDLIEVTGDTDLSILHNTLSEGNRAIHINNNTGNVTIAFNHIANNLDYAIFRTSETDTGETHIYANNILKNRSGYQVNCNNRGTANHNYWGEGNLATGRVTNCTVSNNKQLGAPILLAINKAGVEAIKINVTETMTYAFNNKIGLRRSEGEDYEVIIVNHGQGDQENIPFYLTGAGSIQACSNFYDVFLAEGASASNLVLALKYDLNNNCISTIESTTYCGLPDRPQQYPLWWYDPANNLTNGWDRTGQDPQGPGAEDAKGQETLCNIDTKEILVIIDDTGRPGISDDLNYTPFVVGLPIISEFSGSFNVDRIALRWATTREIDIQGFYVLRSDTESGPYTRISSMITPTGSVTTGGSYNFADQNITLSRDYYYKIEVINQQGISIKLTDPLQMLSATVTPTFTLTPTQEPAHIPTRTATLYYFNSPTPFVRPSTPTPSGPPTQVRTYGPTPTGTRTFIIKPPEDTATPDPNTGYPIYTVTITPLSGYPPPVDDDEQLPTPTPSLESTKDPDSQDNDKEKPPTGDESEADLETPEVRWIFLGMGVASGLSLLCIVSIFLAKFRLA